MEEPIFLVVEQLNFEAQAVVVLASFHSFKDGPRAIIFLGST